MARFSTDPRLAYLLGNYRHLEDALKELVDNAWDADAGEVAVMLPETLEPERSAITVADNGTGMTCREVESEYLRIAAGRRLRRGPETEGGRKAKGTKGVGKFAGLQIAHEMSVETRARGERTTLHVTRGMLSEAVADLDALDLPMETSPCAPEDHGTTVTLRGLNQRYDPPNADRLLAKYAGEWHGDLGHIYEEYSF